MCIGMHSSRACLYIYAHAHATLWIYIYIFFFGFFEKQDLSTEMLKPIDW